MSKFECEYSPSTLRGAMTGTQFPVRKFDYVPMTDQVREELVRRDYGEYAAPEYTQMLVMTQVAAIEGGQEMLTTVLIPLADDYSSEVDTFLVEMETPSDNWEAHHTAQIDDLAGGHWSI